MRLTAALLLLLLLTDSFFYCLYCNVCIWQREDEVKASIGNMSYTAQASVIKIPGKNITPELLNEDEITWDKTLFDVIKKQWLHDTLCLYALPDAEEQMLVEKVAAYAGASIYSAGNCTVHTTQNATKVLPQVYLDDLQHASLLSTTNRPVYCELTYLNASGHPDIPTPPPKNKPFRYDLIIS